MKLAVCAMVPLTWNKLIFKKLSRPRHTGVFLGGKGPVVTCCCSPQALQCFCFLSHEVVTQCGLVFFMAVKGLLLIIHLKNYDLIFQTLMALIVFFLVLSFVFVLSFNFHCSVFIKQTR